MSKYELSGWEDDELHISLVCLFSNWPDYRIAHYLNSNFGFHFENRESGYLVKRHGVSGLVSVFHSIQSDISNTYLIDNLCFTTSSQSGKGLFSGVNFIDQFSFIKSLSRWPYLLVNTNTEPTQGWNPLYNNNIITNKSIDIQQLNKTEQKAINEFIYAE